MSPARASAPSTVRTWFVVLLLVSVASAASAQTTTPAPGTAAPSLVLVCGPAAQNAPASTTCPDDANGNPQVPVVLQGYVLSSADYSALQAAIAPFDGAFAASCFAMGLGAVLAAYFLALPVGILVRMIGLAR